MLKPLLNASKNDPGEYPPFIIKLLLDLILEEDIKDVELLIVLTIVPVSSACDPKLEPTDNIKLLSGTIEALLLKLALLEVDRLPTENILEVLDNDTEPLEIFVTFTSTLDVEAKEALPPILTLALLETVAEAEIVAPIIFVKEPLTTEVLSDTIEDLPEIINEGSPTRLPVPDIVNTGLLVVNFPSDRTSLDVDRV